MTDSEEFHQDDAQNQHRGDVALITGSNRGIGYETARQLGEKGMTVLVSARDEARGTDAAATLREDNIDAHFLQIDVTDSDTIEAAAEAIEAEFGRLNVLVNNAGVNLEETQDSPPSEVPVETLHQTYEVNLFGVIAVTNTMLPLLDQANGARIVNVSSSLGAISFIVDYEHPESWATSLAYSSSKTALNVATILYAKELRDADILVNSVNPGQIATDLTEHTGDPVEEGAAVLVHAATLPADGPSGRFLEKDEQRAW